MRIGIGEMSKQNCGDLKSVLFWLLILIHYSYCLGWKTCGSY